MNAATTSRAAGFALRLPDNWVEFDVWRATRTGDLARLVDSHIGRVPELASRRGVLLKALRDVATQAERQGAIFCAAMADSVADAGVLAATLVVFQTDPALDPRTDTVEVIASQVTATAPTDGSPYWRHVEVVELPAGRAVRMFGVEAAEVDAHAPLPGVIMQTLVPVPGGQGVLNVVLTSPMVDLAEPMLDLFDAISATLTWSAAQDGPAGANTPPTA